MVEPVVRRTARQAALAPAIASVFLIATVARAQAPSSRTFHPVSSYSAETLLRRAADQARQGQWSEALDLYQKVIGQPGEAMAAVPKDDPMADPSGGSQLYVDARRHAQGRIATLPPEARVLYRSRVDAQAERWYRQGAAERDRGALRKVVDQAFCSSWGDDALDLLGDMAFQDGQFSEALAAYRRLAPGPKGGAAGLAHPDPDLDPARIAAKILLARAAIGTDPPTAADLKAFAAAYPDAKGSIAGREGSLAANVDAAIASDHLALPPQSDGRWPTFAGSPSRSKIAPGPIDIGQFQWQVKLDAPASPRGTQFATRNDLAMGMGSRSGTASLDPPPAFYPIVLGDQVVVCDEGRIIAYHLNARPNGPDAGAPAAGASEEVIAWDQKLLSPFSAKTGGGVRPRFTLTASGDRIFARLGPSGRTGGGSTLIAVRNNRDIEGKRLWEKQATDIALPRARPDAPNRFSAVYEGSPVADANNVYIALTENNNEIGAFVACLDAETGATRWVKSLGTAPAAENGMMMGGMNMGGGMGVGSGTADIGNRLLSLDSQTVYYQTNLGAVAALDCETGALQWLATYPTRDRTVASPAREANPAIVHDGLVLVAPDDALPIFAFDAATGRMLWKTRPMDKVAHLLGVAKGRLVATGDRVYSFDLKDGSTISTWPDGPSGFEGYGRGLLAGDSIYWPTKTDIYVLDQATGAPGNREPIRLMQHYGRGGGNLAVGDGYLIIAQKDSLVVFAQNSRLIDRFRQEIAKAPDRAAPHFQLARVAEATGQDALALESLDETIRLAQPSDTIDGQPLAAEARAKQYKLLVRLANQSLAAEDWAGAVARFARAGEVARTDRDRLATRLRLAEAQTRSGDAKAAVATLQAVLGDKKLRAQTVAYDDRWTVRADLFIADELAKMLREGGREIYADYDRKAEELLERGRRDRSARDLEEVGRAYPAARVAAEAVLTLGALREAEGKPAEAARAYRRLATVATTDSQRARALLGLARAYQAGGAILPAREALGLAQARFSDLRLDEPPPGGTVGSIVAETLARPPFDSLAGGDPGFGVPLVRLWDRTWPAPVRPIVAEGAPPSPTAGRIFLADRTAIRPVDPASGESPWTCELGEEPSWVGYLADRLIVATATRIVALDPAGEVRWRYPEDASRASRPVVNPFAPAAGVPRPAGNADRRDPPLGRLHDFRIVGGRVFCLRGDRELLALDGDTGGVEWTYAPAAGGINPNLTIGLRRVVLQLVDPEALVVLDTETGRRREFPRSARDRDDSPSPPWARPPLLIDDDHVCVAIDPRTVALLNLDGGARTWTSRVPSASLPRNGPPRLLGDSNRLLVLYEGNELIRLDPATGRQLWSRSLGLEDDLSEHPDAFALDGDRFFCATSAPASSKTSAALSAYDLADGRLRWSRPLIGPRSSWSIALSERYVAAFPSPGRSPDGTLDGLPLVVCRRDGGALVQRLSFPSGASDLAVRLLPRGAMIATQAGVWALGEIKEVDGAGRPR